MSDLATIFPATEVTLSTGEVLVIKPFKFGQLPKVMHLSRGIFGHIQALFSSGADLSDAALISEVLAHGGEQFIQLIALAVNKDREWFDELEAVDGVQLATTFLEVNVSFFAQKLLPELKKSAQSLNKIQPGLMQSAS